ncbi:hypothetical protein JL475_11465 [Streptomyces sp. M2CJ-2]|uniref:hypothetical protein n=1 Tax=Streptomyces sp. M2CJ-2 TaxID=2803948 RepID=UPI0019207458|nr:hypothetical protein [Streptomyces sp. M2CJ-2]MBL3666599.1 hypothetical protein [Streptomyces sp. M2CJ-2]
MFEIRIICDPSDTDRVCKALATAFATGPVRQYATREGGRARLYITADHGADGDPEAVWPTPEEAYALAPSIISEIGWTARTATDKPFGHDIGREYWLRKAALLDRIALADGDEGIRSDAAVLATDAARGLVDRDDATVSGDPRGYVRQQYAHWAQTK